MKDRVSLYPGRVRLTPVSGQENTYDMVRSDEPTQEGTPLSKATFLKDATAALFGLDATAVPDDVLGVLSRFNKGLGNEYVWEKTRPVFSHKTTTYDASRAVIGTSATLYYGDTFSISGSNFVIDNPITISPTLTESSVQVLSGKYFTWQGSGTYSIIMKIPEEAEITVENGGVYASSWEQYEKPSITTEISYVNSPDPNAYPPAVSDGYTYTPFGQIGRLLNHVGTVSYTGTGVSSVTVLTEFKAKFAIISSKSAISNYWRLTFAVGDYGGCSFQIYDGTSAGKMGLRVTSSMGDSSITITNVRNEAIDINNSGTEYLLTYFG